MLHSSIDPTLTRLELAANILAYEDMAARGNTLAAEVVASWESMLALALDGGAL